MANINKAKLFDNASKFISKNQLDRAIKELNKILKADPDDVRARLKIGDLYAKKSQTAEACEAYRIVAESYSNDGFFLKAVAVYKQILKLDPSLTEVHLKLGDLYHQLGLVSDAMQQYQIVANFYQSKGMNRESLEVLRRMVDLDPENIQSRKNVAELLAREGHTEEALEEFKQIASDLEQNNRIEDLVQVLERIAHLDADDIDVVKRVAQLYLERGDPKRSLAKLQVLFRSNPQDLETLEMLSRAFLSLNQPHKAKSVYREMAKLHEQAGDNGARDDVLRKILDLDPNDQEAQNLLHGQPAQPQAAAPQAPPDPLTTGAADPMTGQPAPVEEPAAAATMPEGGNGASQAQAAAGGSDDPATISKLLTEADVYLKYGLLDRALDHLRNIVSRNPDNFEAHAKLKEVYLQHKDSDNAVAEILILADLAEKDGRADEAQALLEEGLQIAPGNPDLVARMGGSAGAPPAEASAGTEDEASAVEVSIDDDVSLGLEDGGPEPLPEIEEPAAEAAGGGDGIEISIDDDTFDAGEIEVDDPFAAGGSEGAEVVDLDEHRADTELDAAADDLIAEAAGEFDAPVMEEPADEVSIDITEDDLPDPAAMQEDDGAAVNASTDTSFEADMAEIGGDDDAVIDDFQVSIDDDGIPAAFADAEVAGDEPPGVGEAEAAGSEEPMISPPLDDLGDLDMGLDTDLGAPPEAEAEPAPISMAPEPQAEAPAPEPAPPAPALSDEPIEVTDEIPAECAEEVDEAEFFLSQEIFDEAIRVLEKLCKKHPGNTALQAKLQHARKVEAGEGAAAPEEAAPVAAKPSASTPAQAAEGTPAAVPKETPQLIDTDTDLGGGFDLAAELASELDGFEEDEPAFGEEDEYSFDEVLKQFKKGVDKTIGQDDKQARFDLGLAYKDMGLFDEAIAEFEIAMTEPARRVECLGMIAVVQREKGDYESAISTFEQALEGCSDDRQKPGLLFDLALTREAMGENDAALELLNEVLAIDSSFRGVKQKIAELSGGDDSANGSGSGPSGSANANGKDSGPDSDADDDDGSVRKSKISYV